MQLKNSFALITALTAGSAVARLHGHARRHHHQERAVGDIVYAVIDGEEVSWTNTYAGPTAAVEDTSASSTTAPAVASAQSTGSATSSSATSSSSSASGSVSTGFGGRTSTSGTDIAYCGNRGVPYGSNIIEIAEDAVSNFQCVLKVVGDTTEKWTMAVWNKCGPDAKLDGWYGHAALTIPIEAGETKYIALDDDTQGALGAAAGDTVTTDKYGGYATTWGEFDCKNSQNKGWSGFDVSAIQAQNAGLTVQGMQICTDSEGTCSTILSELASVINAYTKDLADVGGIGGNIATGGLSLTVKLNYSQ